MAFDFPASPSVGTLFAPAGGPTWQWDGNVWLNTSPVSVVSNVVVTVATVSATYTKPAGLKFLEVWAVGGGGGGGVAAASAAGQSSAAAGGGAGGVVYKLYAAAVLSATTAYTVAAGGGGGTGVSQPGQAGGTTSFAGLTASGGAGGSWQASTASLGAVCGAGPGGAAAGGDLNLPGGEGIQGLANPHNRVGTAMQGGGGGNFFAPGTNVPLVTGVSAGVAGKFPGGGGCGSSVSNVAGAITVGGAGAAGCIILKEYF